MTFRGFVENNTFYFGNSIMNHSFSAPVGGTFMRSILAKWLRETPLSGADFNKIFAAASRRGEQHEQAKKRASARGRRLCV